MSGIDPGRPKIEEREAQYISVGTHILLDSGVEWTVSGWRRASVPGRLSLYLSRTGQVEWRTFGRRDLIRCRVVG